MTLVASFDWHFIWEHIPDFWTGLKATLKVAAIGIGGSLAIGARIALPSSINTYVSVLKNTSLLTAIGFAELTDTAYSLESQSFKPSEVYFALGATYLLVVWTLSALVRLVERRLSIPEAR